MNATANSTASQLARITLTSFKFVGWMSEETNCFTANVLLDGKRIGQAENDGHGGSTFVHFTSVAVRENAEAFAATILPADVAGWEFLADRGFSFDDLVDLAVERELKKKDIDRLRKRLAKNVHFILTDTVKGHSLKFKNVTDANRADCIAQAKAKIGFAKMISDMSDAEIVDWFMG